MTEAVRASFSDLLAHGCAVVVGTVDVGGVPDATRGWGVHSRPGEATTRVVLAADSEVALANLRSTGAVAVTVTDVASLRSAQAKGRAVALEPTDTDDLAVHEQQVAAFVTAAAEADGVERRLLERLPPDHLVTLVAAFDELFDQTPGPGAGERLPRLAGHR